MNDEKIISSLKVIKLFGEYDVDIEFKKITVLVGKNGLGKTTLLKIIQELMTGNEHFNFEELTKGISLKFSDGNVISHGSLDESLKIIKFSIIDKLTDQIALDANVMKEFADYIDSNPKAEDDVRKTALKKIVIDMLKRDDVFNKTYEYHANQQLIANNNHLAEIERGVNVRYISTVNISASADKNVNIGNSKEYNLLDVAIQEEIRALVKNSLHDKEGKAAFKKQADNFLKESGKELIFNGLDVLFKKSNNQHLELSELSSGERQLVCILATATNTRGKPSLFLMDEPEVSLHLSWQEKIIDAIMALNRQMQIIAVTHSPGIVMNGHMDAYVEMKDVIKRSDNV